MSERAPGPGPGPAFSAAGGQTGDVTIENVAGGGVYHGLSGEQLAKILEKQSEFYMTLVTAYERQYKHVQEEIGNLRDELDMYRAGEANARKAREERDAAERRARQELLDRRLALIAGVLVALSAMVLIYIAANL